MNTQYFSCSYQLQFYVVFSGPFDLVICMNLSKKTNLNLPFDFFLPICEINQKVKTHKFGILLKDKFPIKQIFLIAIQNWSDNKKNKKKCSCQTKHNLIVWHNPHAFRGLCKTFI